MEKTSEFLIYLMACSLQGTKPEEALLVNIDMEALLRLAKAHSVSAMVCMALEQTDAFRCAEESIRLKWLDAKNKAVRKNMLLDAERHQLEKEFAEHGIWYLLSRIFPGREWCEAYAPTVYKYPVLLPFFWVWRLIYKGITNRKKVTQEIKTIKAGKQN